MIRSRPDLPPEDIVTLEVSLINLAYKCYRDRVDMIDTVLDNTKQLFNNAYITTVEHRTPVGRELEKLLKIPIDSYNGIMIVLGLIPTPEKAETILTLVGPLSSCPSSVVC